MIIRIPPTQKPERFPLGGRAIRPRCGPTISVVEELRMFELIHIAWVISYRLGTDSQGRVTREYALSDRETLPGAPVRVSEHPVDPQVKPLKISTDRGVAKKRA
jgi:hypothetical protein